jgi:lipopolysaccharide/colanic/teichoic acid biosynthesis glycosyltransferase
MNIWSDPGHPPDWGTIARLNILQKSQSRGIIDYINPVTSLTGNASTPTTPVIRTLLDETFQNERTVELLQKARALAAQGKFLTQAEIDELPDGFIWY